MITYLSVDMILNIIKTLGLQFIFRFSVKNRKTNRMKTNFGNVRLKKRACRMVLTFQIHTYIKSDFQPKQCLILKKLFLLTFFVKTVVGKYLAVFTLIRQPLLWTSFNSWVAVFEISTLRHPQFQYLEISTFHS